MTSRRRADVAEPPTAARQRRRPTAPAPARNGDRPPPPRSVPSEAVDGPGAVRAGDPHRCVPPLAPHRLAVPRVDPRCGCAVHLHVGGLRDGAGAFRYGRTLERFRRIHDRAAHPGGRPRRHHVRRRAVGHLRQPLRPTRSRVLRHGADGRRRARHPAAATPGDHLRVRDRARDLRAAVALVLRRRSRRSGDLEKRLPRDLGVQQWGV